MSTSPLGRLDDDFASTWYSKNIENSPVAFVSGLAVFDWSRDGRELVTIEYESEEYRRELINASTQKHPPTQ
jgi:hypothetical protein